MAKKDWDDSETQQCWLEGERTKVERYLADQGVVHRGVQARPAWFVAPYMSLWEVRAPEQEASGWWSISGDLPTDYLSAQDAKDARSALRAFADRWQEAAASLIRGEQHPCFRIGPSIGPETRQELGCLLKSRASVIRLWAEGDSHW